MKSNSEIIISSPTNFTSKNKSTEYLNFVIDTNELFNIDLTYPGIRGILNKSFLTSKAQIPVDTGVLKRSFTMRQIDNSTIECYFDPQKIIGQERHGYIVKENYSLYVANVAQHANWLQIVVNTFYDVLYDGARELKKQADRENKEIEKDKKDSSIIFLNNVITFEGYMILKNQLEINKKNQEELLKKAKQEQLLRIQANIQLAKKSKKLADERLNRR